MTRSTFSLALCALTFLGCGGGEPRTGGTPAPAAAPAGAPQAAPVAGLGEIKGLVFDDKNKNAILEAGDTGMAGQTVTIVTSDGEKELRSTTTGADGTFTFDKLEAGQYRLKLRIPNGFERTMDDSFVVTVRPDVAASVRFGLAPR